ncbi:hypothetical protein FRC11_010174 [Ceratobasidium sp. 423]|nr:hypothetical protein FRC11_010174 [Ceratobasidium sp. 423]
MSRLGVHKILSDIEKKRIASVFQDIDLLPDAVEHISRVLRPLERSDSPSQDLYESVQYYKQCVDAAIMDYERGVEFRHYCHYIFDLSYEIKAEDEDEQLVNSFRKHNEALKEIKAGLKIRKKKKTLGARNRQLCRLAVEASLAMVGHTDVPSLSNVYCMDTRTHEKLDPRSMLIKGIDKIPEDSHHPTTASGVTPPKLARTQSIPRGDVDPSVPLPATDNPFGGGFVETEAVVKQGFKIFKTGTVYGFAHAPDETYSMVFAVQFCPLDKLGEVEKQAVNTFVEFLPKAAAHAYEVKGNKAQNAGSKRKGRLYSAGWRPGTTHGEMVAEYTAQSEKDKHNPSHYMDLYDCQEPVNAAWMILQEGLSPRAVMTTVDTLADTAVPMFGSHSSDIATHGPSLGSNMAVSQHDKEGCGFANAMHVDRDMDSLPQYYGKVFTFGQWLHIDNTGRLVEGEKIKAAIPDGLFVIPGYKVAFDLGAAGLIKAIWRGGMDMHGTTTSKVDVNHGITRWGMSIQTNRGLNQRMRSGKGQIFGAYDRLHEYYKLFSEPVGDDEDEAED